MREDKVSSVMEKVKEYSNLSNILRAEFGSYYENNDLGHGLKHVEDVITVALHIKLTLKLDIPDKLIYIAAYVHDMYSNLDRVNHANLAANYVYSNANNESSVISMLTDKEAELVQYAVKEHRASYVGEFFSPLSELMSSADRGLPMAVLIARRVLECTTDEKSVVETGDLDATPIQKAVHHLKEKFSSSGYAKYPKMYREVFGVSLYEVQQCFDNITVERLQYAINMSRVGDYDPYSVSNEEYYYDLYDLPLYPKVKILQLTDLKVADIAIGTCWDKQRADDEVDIERMDRVANKHKHQSTIEHLVVSFSITGMSRAILQEHARHRMASLSVKSTRYTLKELKGEQPFLLENDQFSYETIERASKYLILTDNRLVNTAIIKGLEETRKLIEAGISNDYAKLSLVESYATELVWTINFRSLKNFLKLRTDKASHFQIRRLAYAIYRIIPKEYHFLLKDEIYSKQ